jgi:hypothetical protein
MKLFTIDASRPALGPTQPPIHQVLGPVLRGVKLTTHLHLVQTLRMRGAVSPLPVRLHTFTFYKRVKCQYVRLCFARKAVSNTNLQE